MSKRLDSLENTMGVIIVWVAIMSLLIMVFMWSEFNNNKNSLEVITQTKYNAQTTQCNYEWSMSKTNTPYITNNKFANCSEHKYYYDSIWKKD